MTGAVWAAMQVSLFGGAAQLRSERSRLAGLGVQFNPAINEDLAATAIWGAQNLNTGGVSTRFDGVFGLWYGKGPGVERSTDAMRTANYFGTARLGGVLALAGDDHEARSTVTAQQSETLFLHMGMPILSPATLQEFLTYGLAGWALSRYSKLWVGMICLNDLVDAAATIDLGRLPTLVVPDGDEPPPSSSVKACSKSKTTSGAGAFPRSPDSRGRTPSTGSPSVDPTVVSASPSGARRISTYWTPCSSSD